MKIFRNNFFIAFVLLSAYMATSPYIYGWDDQHLEIPILKHLIDPSLYKGDYYVESAAKYFTCWLYPLLAKLITVKQIPAAYLVLFVFSRYWMFYFVYRLWLLICGSVFNALITSLMFIFMGRTDEFLYRSFCHEEFSFMFMFAGIYCFYRERYWAAAFIFGLGVNSHAIYNLFPMLYMCVFLLFCHPRRFKTLFQTGALFIMASMPFLLWQIPISLSREVAHSVPACDWLPLYRLSCFQNFLFSDTPLSEVLSDVHKFFFASAPYLLIMGMYLFHWVFNPAFRQDKKAQAVMGLSWFLLGIVYYFDYVHPSRFVVDLNLVRVEQYMRFFMMGFTAIWLCEQINYSKPWLAFAAALMILGCASTDLVTLCALTVTAMIFTTDRMLQKPVNRGKITAGTLLLTAAGVFVYALAREIKNLPNLNVYITRDIYILLPMTAVFITMFIKKDNPWLRKILIIIPVFGTFCICVHNYYLYWDLKATGPSGWQLQRNWEDMQFYVRDHTPKDAVVLTPYDMPMGGFRIHSERKVVVCYRDCGIIGFDYAAAVEWYKRINDIEAFKVFSKNGIEDAVIKAIVKYNATYVVFMKYYEPPPDNVLLKKLYENDVFALYQVK